MNVVKSRMTSDMIDTDYLCNDYSEDSFAFELLKKNWQNKPKKSSFLRFHYGKNSDEYLPLEKKFHQLVASWKKDSNNFSSFTNLILNQHYQQIIGIGPPVISLLLKELQTDPDHWGWALQMITGENPVSITDSGNLKAITQAWLDWGKVNGYIF